MDKQKTIQNEVSVSGRGLHTGHQVTISFKPAAENTGICFIRKDLPGHPSIKAALENVITEQAHPRCTSIGKNGIVIHTVEHFLSALAGLQIDNLIIEIDNDELPGLDGSSLEFFKLLRKAQVIEQSQAREYVHLKQPVGIELDGASLFIAPATDFRVSYTLDYDNPVLKSQFLSITVDEKTFESEIAPARTFCLEREVEELRKRGIGVGADYVNTLVVGEQEVKGNKLRFANEFVRHKILDLIGDLYLLGKPLRGHVFAVKSGHRLNRALLRKIAEENGRLSRKVVPFPKLNSKGELNVEQIMQILPHRYPFLLLDRVLVFEKGKRVIGLKNVTINDYFFQGHFPSRPVMPGVLMVEAMAQLGGIAILTNEEHHGKVAFFMAADNVKFRKVVVPGDQLILEAELIRDRSRTAQVRGQAKVNNEVVAEADMMFSFTDASYLSS